MNPQNLHAHEDRLLDFAYGELPVSEARVVEAHLQGCARCTQALHDIRGVRVTMSQLSSMEPAPDAGLESLLAYAHQAARRSAAGPEPKPSRWRRWLLPVVGLASVSTLGILTFQARNPELTRPDLSQAAAVESVRSKEEAPGRGAPAEPPAPPSAAAPAPAQPVVQEEYAQAPLAAAPEEKREDAQLQGKGALKAQGQLADNWANSGSGGGLDTRRSRDVEAKKSAMKKDMSFGAEERSRGAVAKKPASTGKLAGSKLAELDEESFSSAEGLALEAPKSAPVQEPLRVGGPSRALAGVASDDVTADALTVEPEAEAPADEDKAAPSMAVATGAAAPAAAMPPPPAPTSAPAPAGAIGRADLARERAEQAVTERRAPATVTASAPSKAKRAEPVANNAPPPPVQRQATSERAPSVAELSRRAQEAKAAGDRAQEAALLRSALAARATGTERLSLLNRLCEAEFAQGRFAAGQAACNQVLAEAPGTSEAQVARRRLLRGDANLEAPAKPAEGAK